MQREIKFRAWNTVWKCMHQLIGFKLAGKKHTQLYYVDADGDSTTCTVKTENIILLQYTGLHDENGKKIYEGDIFHLGDRNILYVVVWHDTGLRGKQARASSYVGLEHWKERIKVIGNVYENPELLEVSE